MSQIGIDFANQWVAENIRATVFAPDDGLHPETADCVKRLVADAKGEEISRREIEEDMGDLSEFISAALNEAAEGELDRLEDDD